MNLVLSDKALWVPAIAWCVSQALKAIISSIKNRRFNFSYFVAMGGMPSSHATLVCALATTVAIVYGVNSAVFAIAAFLALVVMYDAAGVRQTVSTQSTILNRILDFSKGIQPFSNACESSWGILSLRLPPELV